jgi:preprotein translocase subunit SecE
VEQTPVGAFLHELICVGIYKRSQGRITRQVTFGALALIFAVGFHSLYLMLDNSAAEKAVWGIEYWLPGILVAVCWWISYRLVNLPSFADFLIAVEAELNKVSWPTRSELIRSSFVVLICLLLFAALIFGFDLIWHAIFKYFGILGGK